MSRRAFINGGAIVAAIAPLGISENRLFAAPAPLTYPRQAEFASLAGPLELVRNENPCGISPLADQELCQVPKLYHRYVLQDRYLWELKQALAIQAGIPAEGTKLAAGSSTILFQALQRFAARTLIISNPEFYRIFVYTESLGSRVSEIAVEPDRLRPDLSSMAQAARAHPNSLIYLSNPHLPYGGFFNPREIEAFLHKVPKETVVLVDEAYIH